jgi:hypothetical protein
MPCERLCWTIDGAAGEDGDDDGGAGDDLEDLPALVEGADPNALGAALIGCARTGARRCWDEAAAGQLTEDASWTSLFFECAEPFLSTPLPQLP